MIFVDPKGLKYDFNMKAYWKSPMWLKGSVQKLRSIRKTYIAYLQRLFFDKIMETIFII